MMRPNEPKTELQVACEELFVQIGEHVKPLYRLIATPMRFMATFTVLLLFGALLGYLDSGVDGAAAALGLMALAWFVTRLLMRRLTGNL